MTAEAGVRARRRWPSLELLTLALVLAALLQPRLTDLFARPLLQTWSTIFVSISVQALPFLVLGVVVSGAIASYVSPRLLARILPTRPGFAVPVAGAAGLLLPGCECGSVPIAGRLIARGAAPAAALTFLLSAPAINPIVLVSTAVAFPGRPEMVVARFLASLATALVVGLVWMRLGRDAWVDQARRRLVEGDSRWEVFTGTVRYDFLHAGGFLVVGAGAAATLQTVVPRTVLDTIAGSGLLAVAAMATLAIVLAICSEADAFVAASLSQFSLTARLVFLVVGPAVDIKLVALQTGIFGRAFTYRFVPLALAASVGSALAFGWWLL